jgi:hypothetical protein
LSRRKAGSQTLAPLPVRPNRKEDVAYSWDDVGGDGDVTVHVATVHFRSPRWIDIQVTHLRRHVPAPLMIWGGLQGVDSQYYSHFDRAIEHRGRATHPEKLNHLALEISSEAAPDDLVMFLDGDAFPIADLGPLLTSALSEAPLVAVRRIEQANEPHPHPCFCVTTVGFWRSLPGDWSQGHTWIDDDGTVSTGPGANLLRTLELTNTPWLELHRSNANDLHPSLFSVYGGVVYHHGASFRQHGVLLRSDREAPPPLIEAPSVPGLAPAVRRINRMRLRRWRREREQANAQLSETVYRRIADGDPHWLASVAGDAVNV